MCREWFCRRAGDRDTRVRSGSSGIAESNAEYWVVAEALLLEVVEEAGLAVGVSAFVVGRVKEGAVLSAVLLFKQAGRGLEGSQEVLQPSAVLQILDPFAHILVSLMPFVHAPSATSNINYYTHTNTLPAHVHHPPHTQKLKSIARPSSKKGE